MSPEEFEDQVWQCRGCGADVVTAYSAYGKRMCVDAKPYKSGNLDLVEEVGHLSQEKFLVARIYQRPPQSDALFDVEPVPDFLYKDHHATCPVSSEF